MHRIFYRQYQELIDHINCNKLDNRKCNLRNATHQENVFNKKCPKNNKSGHRGIRIMPSGRFSAYITINKKQLSLGTYDTFEEAKNAFLAGADIISTTLSGYTKETSFMPDTPDFNLLEKCTKELKCPVISEGKIWNKEDIKKAFDLGAHSVVIGSAVTRPHKIIEKFKEGLINGN